MRGGGAGRVPVLPAGQAPGAHPGLRECNLLGGRAARESDSDGVSDALPDTQPCGLSGGGGTAALLRLLAAGARRRGQRATRSLSPLMHAPARRGKQAGCHGPRLTCQSTHGTALLSSPQRRNLARCNQFNY